MSVSTFDEIIDNVVFANKPKSLSPLEHLKLIKNEINHKGKACYIGRLDPMARGKIVYLLNSKTKQCKKYMSHDKIYQFDIVCGISTDSMDCMGKVMSHNMDYCDNLQGMITNIKKGKYMKYIQTYPECSAYVAKHPTTGEKKPMWLWKKENRIDEINIPQKEIKLTSLNVLSQYVMTMNEYIDKIIKDISKVTCFPQEQILPIIEQWQDLKQAHNSQKIHMIKCEARVKTGTFIRYLVDMIGKDHNIPTHAYDINRTWIGMDV